MRANNNNKKDSFSSATGTKVTKKFFKHNQIKPKKRNTMKKRLLYLAMLFMAFVCNVMPVNAQVVEVLKDVWPGIGNSSSIYNWMASANGKLFFTAEDDTHGMELWVSDGTDAGTTLLKDIYPGVNTSSAGWAGNFTVCNNKLFFVANDGIHGSELWATDGTEAGTYMVKDIGNDTEVGIAWSGLGGYGASGLFYTYNNKVYFPACDGRTSVGQHDTELWCSDGTEAGTYMVKDIRPDEGSTPKQFCEFNGLLYFEAYDGGQGQGGHGGELWVTDGTEAGTQLFKDIAAVASSENPGSLTVCEDKMFFTTDDGIHGRELWVTDGTDAGTHLVKDIRTDGYGSYPGYLTVFDGILYFKANESNSVSLWRSDGTEAGTYKVTNDLHNPVNLRVYNDKLFFLASDITGGSGIGNYELWSWSEISGVTLVKEINPNPNFGIDFNPGSNFPEGFVEYNGLLYFRAADDGYGTTIWQTDGTEEGTIAAPGQENFTYPDPVNPMYIMSFDFQVFNGSLYYPAGYEDDPAFEVYKITSVLAYTVTGGGYYCDGMDGLPVGLSGSNVGVTYTLYKNDIAQLPTITGTGNAISFGNQLAGTYTIKATDANGTTTNMNGNAIILEGTLPVSVTAAPDQNGVCAGTTITFTATPVNGGTPAYQWYKNDEPVGSNQGTYAFIPDDNDNVYVQLTSSLTCTSGNPAMSEVTVMNVFTSLEPGVTITAFDSVCGGSNVQYFAEHVNGGTTPSYQWYKNNEPVGANQATYSYVTAWVNEITNDNVYVVMTSDLTCVINNPATSDVDTLAVLPRPFVEVSIEADNEIVCDGTPVTITAIPVNGGNNPTYYWNVNDNPVSTTNEPTFTYVPGLNDFIYVMLNSDLPCTQNDPATSNYIYIMVNSLLTPSVVIAASENPVQSGVPVTFTPSPLNGGTPTYQWFVNGSYAGTVTPYTYTPEDGDQIYAEMASSLECITAEIVVSNTILMDVITGIDINDIPGLKVYSFDKVIYLESTTGLTGEAVVYDIAGREIGAYRLSGQLVTQIPVAAVSGVYLVKVSTSNGLINKKVFVR
jgi:ELWxxDGT repeat protein